MRYIKLFLMSLLLIGLVACTPKDKDVDPPVTDKEFELLTDNKFQNGFTVSPADNEPQPDNRYPLDYNFKYGSKDNPISWLVGLPGNRYGLADDYALSQKEIEKNNDDYIIEDYSKKMIVNPDLGRLTLELNASKEYLSPRKEKEAWPHLLLQQGLKEQISIDTVSSVTLNLDLTLNKLERHMTDQEYNSDLHATQFIMYIVMQTNNPQDAGDFLWFGIPFLDSRYKFVPEAGMIDAGTAGNTGQFIYHMPQKEYMSNGLPLNEKVNVNVDIIPYLSRALNLAKQKGALLNSTINDLYLTNMNIGYEIPGTFDVSITMQKFSLLARRK